MRESSPITQLGKRERIGNQKVTCALTLLAVLTAWISLTGFDQPLILANIITTAYGQQESLSSETSTPFLEWYQTQGANQQIINPLAVKITSPVTGQQVPAGQSVIISGVSSDNSTSECKVSVIVNAEKPYQPAVANGTGGINDYSTWNFNIAPTYTTIREGPDNKITSKLECTPNLTKWYSVNVTGIGSTTPVDRAATTMQPPLPLPVSPFASDDNIPDSSPLIGSANTSTFTPESAARPTSPSLSISVDLPSNPVAVGDDETIEATVLDAVSNLQINNAILELVVTDSAGNPVDESSDNDGDLSYTLDTAADNDSVMPGTFTATLRASAVGYEPESKTVTFDLVEEVDDDTENFGPLSSEESDSDDDNSDDDTDDTLFDEESGSGSDDDGNNNGIGELFE
jgi:hypothetical protein